MVEVEDEFEPYRNEYTVSNDQRALYFINALIVSLVPVYLYHAIFFMTFETYIIVYASVTLFSAIVLTFAYNNIYRIKRLKLAATREHSLTKAKTASKTKQQLMAKKEVQSVVTSREAVAHSIMYNNAIFLVSVLAFSYLIFKNLPLVYNYITSVSMAAGLTAFLSTGTKH
eukprot:gene5625-7000_t